jgi:hypothetical protein
MSDKIVIKARTKEFEFDSTLLSQNSTFFDYAKNVNTTGIFDFSYVSDEVIQYLSDFLQKKHKDFQLEDAEEGYQFASMIEYEEMGDVLAKEDQKKELFDNFMKEGLKSLNECDNQEIEYLMEKLKDKPELQNQAKEHLDVEAIYEFWMKDDGTIGSFIDDDIPKGLREKIVQTIKDFIKANPKEVEEDLFERINTLQIKRIDMELVRKDIATFCRLYNAQEGIHKFLKNEKHVSKETTDKKKKKPIGENKFKFI